MRFFVSGGILKMKPLFLCYPKCSTCRKAEQFLLEHEIGFTFRNIAEDRPGTDELAEWIARSGLPLRRFFNTSGLKYKALGLKDKLKTMSEPEQIALLASDGMLVKRPLLIAGDAVLVGFNAAEWEKFASRA